MGNKQVGFLKRVAKALTDSDKLKTPSLVKEATESIQLIEQYKKEIEMPADENQIKSLNEKIKLLELGLKGEKSVLFELQNSFLPIQILHDVRVAYKGLTCQIDFVVITRKFILVIEVKNYYGNILINEKDEFIRQVYKSGKLTFSEGFYSPIRQVERQVEVLDAYLREVGAISKTPIKSVVVFSNNKTVINSKNASKHVKAKIMRVDSLVEYLKRELGKSSPVQILDNRMNEISEYIKSSHIELIDDVADAVEMKLLEETVKKSNDAIEQTENDERTEPVKLENMNLEESLKQFRMRLATEQNAKAFHIFTNKTLDELIQKQPSSLDDLKSIHGIGEVKINAFGEELVGIIKEHKK